MIQDNSVSGSDSEKLEDLLSEIKAEEKSVADKLLEQLVVAKLRLLSEQISTVGGRVFPVSELEDMTLRQCIEQFSVNGIDFLTITED